MVQIQTLQLWKLLLSVSQLYAVFSPPERIRREIFTSSKPDVERNAASKHVTQPAHRRETLIREHQKKSPFLSKEQLDQTSNHAIPHLEKLSRCRIYRSHHLLGKVSVPNLR